MTLTVPVLITPWFSGNRPRELIESLIPMPELGTDTAFTRQVYAALMGLLCSSGATIGKGPNNWHYPRSTILKISSTDIQFLRWLMDFFTPWLTWNPIGPTSVKGASNSLRGNSHNSFFLYILRMHWQHEGLHLLPTHFEEYFDWITLAFWAMRNGQYINNGFMIGVSRLDPAEQQRLIDVLQSKLGLQSRITMGGKRLLIANPELVIEHIRPFFHKSQLSRLVRKSR